MGRVILVVRLESSIWVRMYLRPIEINISLYGHTCCVHSIISLSLSPSRSYISADWIYVRGGESKFNFIDNYGRVWLMISRANPWMDELTDLGWNIQPKSFLRLWILPFSLVPPSILDEPKQFKSKRRCTSVLSYMYALWIYYVYSPFII